MIIGVLHKNKDFTLASEIELRKFLSNKDKKELKKILVEFPDFIVTAEEYLLNSNFK